jgi:hypothetical protein
MHIAVRGLTGSLHREVSAEVKSSTIEFLFNEKCYWVKVRRLFAAVSPGGAVSRRGLK